MASIDEIVAETSDLPDPNDLPRSEAENQQLLALLQSKAAAIRDCHRRLRKEKFHARRQAQQAPEPQGLPSAGSCKPEFDAEQARRSEEAARRISEIRSRLEAATCSSDVLGVLDRLTSVTAAVADWPEAQRAQLQEVVEFGQRRSAELKEAEQAASAALEAEAKTHVEESDGAESDSSEDARKDDELREIRSRKEAVMAEVTRWTSTEKVNYNEFCSAAHGIEDGESTSASRGTSASRDLQKDHPSAPSSARSCSDAGWRHAVALDFGMQPDQEAPPETAPEPEPAQPKKAAAPPPPPRGKGKGKGGPPPPKAKAASKAGAAAAQAAPANNGLHNFFWQVTKDDDVRDCGQEFQKRLEASKVVIDSDLCLAAPSREPRVLEIPQPPSTVFTPSASTAEVPQRVLEHYWKKHASARARLPDAASQEDAATRPVQTILEQKKLEMLGITLKRHERQNKGLRGFEAILSIKMAILRCDFEVVCIECLSVIRTVVKQHESDGAPVCAFVLARGEEVLDGLKCPMEHRLVYELSKVPQIVDRLECMLFHETFQDGLRNYKSALTTHQRALERLNAKRETIQRFFVTALRLGQSLNRKSKNASKAPHGFQLASLEKLSETKSTKLPRLSVLHFVLALMSQEDAQTLFDAEDLALLQEAAVRRTHKVYTDCIELVQGLYGVQQICNTGQYVRPDGETVSMQRRRRSLPASSQEMAEDAAVDDDDHFFEVMKDFVDTNLEDAEEIAEGAFKMILIYKELAVYFDDMRNVYPPPKSENDARKDLVEVFAKFAVQIQQHREQVQSERLRELLHQPGGTEGRGVSLPGTALRPRAHTAPEFSPSARGSRSAMTPSHAADVSDVAIPSRPSGVELAMTPEAIRGEASASEDALQEPCSFRSNLASRFGDIELAV